MPVLVPTDPKASPRLTEDVFIPQNEIHDCRVAFGHAPALFVYPSPSFAARIRTRCKMMNVSTDPTYNPHGIGTVHTYNPHGIGTVHTYNPHGIGTVHNP